MADSRIIPAAYLSGAEEETYDPVSDDCVCAYDTCDECNPAVPQRIKGNSNSIMEDNIRTNAYTACHDTMAACWNAWEAACKFEQPGLAAYYLDLLTLTQQYQKRLLNLKKKNY